MKILFIVPKQKSMFGDGIAPAPHPHVGIAYLASFLKSKGHDVSVYDQGVRNEIGLPAAILDADADLIGITIFSYCYSYAAEVIARARKLTDKPLVIGGPHVSATGKSALEGCAADFAVKGEGELTVLELVDTLLSGEKDFARIEGLLWRDGRRVVENRARKPMKNLDDLPFPDYEAFNLGKYPCAEENMVPIITSRGCPYACNYCSVKLTMGRNFRGRSPENVVEEIESWYIKGWNQFDIDDDCFTLDMERAAAICDSILEKGMDIRYRLYNGIRVDRVSPQLLAKMKLSGCAFVSYGCESANPEVLKTIGKGITTDQVRRAVDWTNEAGIDNAVNFIIGHPGETYGRAKESISFAKSLPTNYVNFYNLVPYPGTALHGWIQDHGRMLLPPETYLSQISYRDPSPVFETTEFPARLRKKALRKGFALYRRRVIQYRLGRVRGGMAAALTRISFIDQAARRLAFNNKVGRRLYVYLSSASRK